MLFFQSAFRLTRVVVFVYIVSAAYFKIMLYIATVLGLLNFLFELIGVTILIAIMIFRIIFFWVPDPMTLSSTRKKCQKWIDTRNQNYYYVFFINYANKRIGKSQKYYDAYWMDKYCHWQLLRYVFQDPVSFRNYCWLTLKDFVSYIFEKEVDILRIIKKYWLIRLRNVRLYGFYWELLRRYRVKDRYNKKDRRKIVKMYKMDHYLAITHSFRKFIRLERKKQLIKAEAKDFLRIDNDLKWFVPFSKCYDYFRGVVFHYAFLVYWFVPTNGSMYYKWKLFYYDINVYVLTKFFEEWIRDADLDRICSPMSINFAPLDFFLHDQFAIPWSGPATNFPRTLLHQHMQFKLNKGNTIESAKEAMYQLKRFGSRTRYLRYEYDEYPSYVCESITKAEHFNSLGNVRYNDEFKLLLDSNGRTYGCEDYYITYFEDPEDVDNLIAQAGERLFYGPGERKVIRSILNDVPIDTLVINLNTVLLVMLWSFMGAFSIVIISRKVQIMLFHWFDENYEDIYYFDDALPNEEGKVSYFFIRDEQTQMVLRKVIVKKDVGSVGIDLVATYVFVISMYVAKLAIAHELFYFFLWATNTKEILRFLLLLDYIESVDYPDIPVEDFPTKKQPIGTQKPLLRLVNKKFRNFFDF